MKMKKATPTTTPTNLLRDRCQSHFLTLRIPVEPAALDELLARAEKESFSHLRFLDLLLGTQADARRERAVARRIRDGHLKRRQEGVWIKHRYSDNSVKSGEVKLASGGARGSPCARSQRS